MREKKVTMVNLTVKFLLLLLIAVFIDGLAANRCRKAPKGLKHGPKKEGDGGYRVFIGDASDGYQPGKIYNGLYFNTNVCK